MSAKLPARFQSLFNRTLESRVFGVLAAGSLASCIALKHALDAPLRSCVGEACRYGWRSFVSLMAVAWFPGAGWYSWSRPSGGCGPARWFWRHPKNLRWEWNESYVLGN